MILMGHRMNQCGNLYSVVATVMLLFQETLLFLGKNVSVWTCWGVYVDRTKGVCIVT